MGIFNQGMFAPPNPKWRDPNRKSHKRVFRKGPAFHDVDSFERWTRAGYWIFWGKQTRAVHPGWARSWQFQMVAENIRGGKIFQAYRITNA